MTQYINVDGHKAVVAKGSKQNGGRKIAVWHVKDSDGDWHTKSKNLARAKYENKNGNLSRQFDVDHKDNNHGNDSEGNLQAMTKSKNIAKGNQHR